VFIGIFTDKESQKNEFVTANEGLMNLEKKTPMEGACPLLYF
jgi:hypothetical protein